MAGFRQGVMSICWVIPTLATFYFWVVALSTFSAAHSEKDTSPLPAPSKCTAEEIKKTMNSWMRWMNTLIITAIVILLYVRKVVEDAADGESKGNSYEEEAYKVAREDLKEAIKATNEALAVVTGLANPKSNLEAVDAYVKALGLMNLAFAKAECAKPKEGLARLPSGKQLRVRALFFLVIFLSFWAGFCASFAFYYSLRLQIGCVDGVIEIAPFIVVGLIFLWVHVYFARVALTQN